MNLKGITAFVVLLLAIGVLIWQWRKGRYEQEQADKLNALPHHTIKHVGASFVISHAKWLSGEWGGPGVGPKWQDSLEQILELGLSPIRLAVQWDQVEKAQGQFDFTEIDEALAICAKHRAKVILCVGAKTPRWPEVHLPDFCKSAATAIPGDELDTSDSGIGIWLGQYIETTVKRYANNPTVEAFQIENEPLEAFGDPKRSIPLASLSNESRAAHRIVESTIQSIAVTMGAGLTGTLGQMKTEYQQILDHLMGGLIASDWVGLDLYQKGYGRLYGITGSFTAGADEWLQAQEFVRRIKAAGKQPFVAELQAEPWEADSDRLDYKNPTGNRSFAPADCLTVFDRASKIGVDTILLWGLEFQVACSKQGNQAWLNATRQIIKRAA